MGEELGRHRPHSLTRPRRLSLRKAALNVCRFAPAPFGACADGVCGPAGLRREDPGLLSRRPLCCQCSRLRATVRCRQGPVPTFGYGKTLVCASSLTCALLPCCLLPPFPSPLLSSRGMWRMEGPLVDVWLRLSVLPARVVRHPPPLALPFVKAAAPDPPRERRQCVVGSLGHYSSCNPCLGEAWCVSVVLAHHPARPLSPLDKATPALHPRRLQAAHKRLGLCQQDS